MSDMDDAFLAEQIGLVNAGDADALHVLIVHYHPMLLRKVAAGFDGTLGRRLDPEDVLQEAYIKAFQHVGAYGFEHAGGFYKWLETIALNELYNLRRNHGRQRRDAGREVHGAGTGAGRTDWHSFVTLAERIATAGTTPSGVIKRKELTAALLGALARLGEEQREVVRLRFLEGRKVAEVAKRLGRSEDAVHALCYRAMKGLKEALGSVTQFMSRG